MVMGPDYLERYELVKGKLNKYVKGSDYLRDLKMAGNIILAGKPSLNSIRAPELFRVAFCLAFMTGYMMIVQ